MSEVKAAETETTETAMPSLATGDVAPAGSVVKESDKPSEDDTEDPNPDEMGLVDFFREQPVTAAPTEQPVTETEIQSPQGAGVVPATTSQVEPTAQPAPQVASPPQVQPQQAAQPAQGTQPQQQAQQVPPQQGDTQAQPGAQQPTQAPDAFGELDRVIEAQRPKVIEAVAVGSYQLSQDELDGLTTEPEKVVPKLLAKVHVNAVQGVLRHVAQQMPVLLNSMLEVREINRAREETFWKQWPQLDRTKHGQQVLQVAQTFRQLNPNATPEQFVQHVGAQVVLMNNLHRQAAPQPQQAQPAPAPFRPAGVGQGGGPIPAQAAQTGGWELITQMMQEGD